MAGKFTQQSHTQKVFEPSAGNAMLTIAYPPDKVYVNELDEERLASLQMQNFVRVTDRNGAKPFPTGWHKQFDAVLTNPPFGTTDKVQAQKYELKGLEHIMAHYALECMQDKGRCAIIIGGHSRYDEQGRPTGGKERNFLYYLHTYYHAVDVINIDGGKLYSRQGTNFPVRLILIDGRQEEPELVLPTVNKEVVSDFATLYNRVFPYILYEQQQPNTILQPRLDTDRMAGADLGYSHSFTSADTDDRATIDVLEGCNRGINILEKNDLIGFPQILKSFIDMAYIISLNT